MSLELWAFASPGLSAEHRGAEREGWPGPRGACHLQAGQRCSAEAQLTWLACPGPWAASRALYSPSDISTRKPVTPSRGCAPWISGSAMMGLDLAALGERAEGQLYSERPPRGIYFAEGKNLPQNVK